jgi:hypothetical protein
MAGSAAFPSADKTVDAHLHTRLYKRKVGTAERDAPLQPEDPPGEFSQRPLEVCHADTLIYGQTLDLCEHPFVSCIRRLEAVALPRYHDPDRRIGLLHDAHLVWRRMGSQ